MVAATTGRFIGVTRGLFGGFSMHDVRWQDFKETKINVGVFGADLTLVYFTSPDLAVTGATRVLSFEGLRKDEAESVYRICYVQEQAWRESGASANREEPARPLGRHPVGAPPRRRQYGSRGRCVFRSACCAACSAPREMLDKGLISDSNMNR